MGAWAGCPSSSLGAERWAQRRGKATVMLSQGMLLCMRPPHDTSTFPPRMSPCAPNLEAAPCASADPIAPPFFGRGVAGHVPGCQAGRGAPVSSVPVVFQRGGVGASWLPPGWNSVAYFKPLAQGVSSSSADFFRTLFVQALRGGRKRGGGRAAPACSAASGSPAPAVVRAAGGDANDARGNEPAARCVSPWMRRGGPKSGSG